MLKLPIFLLCNLTFITIVCAENPSPVNSAPSKATVKADLKLVKRGELIPKGDECLSLDSISDEPQKYSGQTVVVEGTITAVCQAKGCWMTMAGQKATSRARITFKDYAFFVPKDVKGQKVKVIGAVKVKMLSDGERAHLAEDGRVDVSEIPKAELRLVASGVEIRR